MTHKQIVTIAATELCILTESYHPATVRDIKAAVARALDTYAATLAQEARRGD